jgi:1-acyl-sn-glycerol-3-phosphate acyltransferase
VLIWFPEGRRTLTGAVGAFLPGIGVVLERSGAQVVRVRISGSYEAWPWNRRLPRPGRIAITFGAPLGADELEASGEGKSRAERIASGLQRSLLGLGELPRELQPPDIAPTMR